MQKIGIVGCGLSGCAIARLAALAGYDVHICEITKSTLELAFQKSSTFFKRQSIRGALSDQDVKEALAHIHGTLELRDLAKSDVIIDALPENLDAKLHVLQQLDRICSEESLFVSHTSSLSIGNIARQTEHPERVFGLHFLRPIHLVKLAEVVKIELSSPLLLEALCAFVESLNREVIVISDSPGFVTTRLVIGYLLHAVRMLEEGVAAKEEIDKAMRLGCGHPMGPFVLLDFIGIDRVCHIAENLQQELSSEQFAIPELLRQMCELGHLGRQSGQGFYSYPDEQALF
jgi:3-hydroxybutyryl-CoA dehydrogenase